MILEGIVTTLDAEGTLNVAPMGPSVSPDFRRFILKPYRSSTTYQNLTNHGEGVFHVTDDVLAFARSAIGTISQAETRPAEQVRGLVMLDSCRYYEFRVTEVDDKNERVSMTAETVGKGTIREFFGFNRAKHAVLETAILASRIMFLPIEGLALELEKFKIVVQKTGGEPEVEAFRLLRSHIQSVSLQRGLSLELSEW